MLRIQIVPAKYWSYIYDSTWEHIQVFLPTKRPQTSHFYDFTKSKRNDDVTHDAAKELLWACVVLLVRERRL